MRSKLLIVAMPLISACVPLAVLPTPEIDVPEIKPVVITWQPAREYFGESDKLLYGLTRDEYNQLVGFMNDVNRFIQSYKLDNSHERLEDLGDLMFRYDDGGG